MNSVTDTGRTASFSVGGRENILFHDKVWFPPLVWVTAFVGGILLCRCFGLGENENIRLALTSYISGQKQNTGVAAYLFSWLSICLPDIRSLLLIFLSGFCISPAAELLSSCVTVLRGIITGLVTAAAVPVIPMVLTGDMTLCAVLTCTSQLLSAFALVVLSLSAMSFSQRRRNSGSFRIFLRYLLRLCVSMGISAAAGILHLLACNFSGI